MKRKFKNILCAVLCLLLLAGSLCACESDETRGKVIFTTGFGEEELFRIGEASCTMAEYMLYLTNIQKEYEEVFGEEIWEITYEDTTLEENVKDIALAQIAQMKSVYLLAKEKDVTLKDQEEELLKKAAKEYFSSLNSTELEELGVTEETVLSLYTECALAQKVYEQIVAEVNPEISDDEARTITVEQIFIKTYTTDGEGNVIEYSQSMKEECLETMEKVRELAVNGENDFTELAGKYSEEDTIRRSFKKGEVLQALEEVAFNLQTDQISEIIETEYGYYLLKCISTFDREQTDANKLLLIEERKQEAFGQEYDAFVSGLARKLNEKLWEKVELIRTPGVETSSFFEVFNKYFAG